MENTLNLSKEQTEEYAREVLTHLMKCRNLSFSEAKKVLHNAAARAGILATNLNRAGLNEDGTLKA